MNIKKNKLCFVGDCTSFAIIPLFFLLKIGYNIVFIKNPTGLSRKILSLLLGDIKLVDFREFLSIPPLPEHSDDLARISRVFMKRIMKKIPWMSFSKEMWPGVNLKKINACCFAAVLAVVGKTQIGNLLIINTNIERDCRICYISSDSILIKEFMELPDIGLSGRWTVLFPKTFAMLWLFFYMLTSLRRLVVNAYKMIYKMVKLTLNVPPNFRRSKKSSSSNNIKYKVAYFPHKGIAYGNLFAKDYIYSFCEDSAINIRNILHVELPLASESEKNDIISSYSRFGAPYLFLNSPCFFAAITSNQGRKFLSCVIKTLLLYFSGRCSLCAWFFFLSVNYKILIYYEATKIISGVNVAVVGYDFLFPKYLSVALQARNIRTISVQERPSLVWNQETNTILNYYAVWSKEFEKKMREKKFSSVDHFIIVGPPRSDQIIHLSKEKNNIRNKFPSEWFKTKFLIVSFDFHSVMDENDRLNPYVNWAANRIYYQSILRLADDIPEITIVNRSKCDTWCELPFFKKTFSAMMDQPRIFLCRDYDRFNISYELAAMADCIICKHTSIADEALSTGKPVIFHNYSYNCANQFRGYDYYMNSGIFANSYIEIKNMIENFILRFPNDDLSNKAKLIKRYIYEDMADGLCSERFRCAVGKLAGKF